MALFDLFSKRQKRLRGEVPDVYVYDDLPDPLRVQLVQIIEDGIGPEEGFHHDVSRRLYECIHKALCREYGVFSLSKVQRSTHWEAVSSYFLEVTDTEHAIDIVEQCLRAVDFTVRDHSWQRMGCSASPDDTINETNARFREHGVGFEYVSGEMVRIDSQLVHDAVVKPTLKLLADPKFKGANDEFLKAHEHYRHGRHKECLNDCLKAFESTMKTICDQKRWTYQPKDTAKTLIATCMDKGLFPTFLQTHIDNLRVLLESGVPTVRNKLGGHGQGATVTIVTETTAQFVLHTTASCILLFAESV